MSENDLNIKPVCRRCGSPLSNRIERKTFFQKTFLTWFGLFPWECTSCWTVFLSKKRGAKKTRKDHPPPHASASPGD